MEYKSAEERILEFSGEGLAPIKEFGKYFGKTFYGTFVSLLRIPTTIRKANNNQTWMDKDVKNRSIESSDYPKAEGFGVLFGIGGALSLDGYLIYKMISEISHGDYMPSIIGGAIFLTSNLISGIYELGRLERSRREYAEKFGIEKSNILEGKLAASK